MYIKVLEWRAALINIQFNIGIGAFHFHSGGRLVPSARQRGIHQGGIRFHRIHTLQLQVARFQIAAYQVNLDEQRLPPGKIYFEPGIGHLEIRFPEPCAHPVNGYVAISGAHIYFPVQRRKTYVGISTTAAYLFCLFYFIIVVVGGDLQAAQFGNRIFAVVRAGFERLQLVCT